MKKFLAAAGAAVLGFRGARLAPTTSRPPGRTRTFTVGERRYIGDRRLVHLHARPDGQRLPPARRPHHRLPPVDQPGRRRRVATLRDSRSSTCRARLGDAFVYNFGLSGAEYGGWSILGLLAAEPARHADASRSSSIMGDFILVGSTPGRQRLRQRRQRAGTGCSGPAGHRPARHGPERCAVARAPRSADDEFSGDGS